MRFATWIATNNGAAPVQVIGFQLADYYDPTNVDGVKSRDAIALGCLDNAIDFLRNEGGMVSWRCDAMRCVTRP